MDNLVQTLVEFFKDHLSKEVVIFLISLLPVLELRGGLIAAALLGVDWAVAFPICVIGNMLPVPIIILFVRRVFEFLKKKSEFFTLFIFLLDIYLKVWYNISVQLNKL